MMQNPQGKHSFHRMCTCKSCSLSKQNFWVGITNGSSTSNDNFVFAFAFAFAFESEKSNFHDTYLKWWEFFVELIQFLWRVSFNFELMSTNFKLEKEKNAHFYKSFIWPQRIRETTREIGLWISGIGVGITYWEKKKDGFWKLIALNERKH